MCQAHRVAAGVRQSLQGNLISNSDLSLQKLIIIIVSPYMWTDLNQKLIVQILIKSQLMKNLWDFNWKEMNMKTKEWRRRKWTKEMREGGRAYVAKEGDLSIVKLASYQWHLKLWYQTLEMRLWVRETWEVRHNSAWTNHHPGST